MSRFDRVMASLQNVLFFSLKFRILMTNNFLLKSSRLTVSPVSWLFRQFSRFRHVLKAFTFSNIKKAT